VRDQVSHPYSTTGKITALYILIFRFSDMRLKESVQVGGALKYFVTIKKYMLRCCYTHAQPPSWRTTPCRPLRLLILHIRSYPPYPEDFPPSVTWGHGDKGPT
jgi:hypothetical protein